MELVSPHCQPAFKNEYIQVATLAMRLLKKMQCSERASRSTAYNRNDSTLSQWFDKLTTHHKTLFLSLRAFHFDYSQSGCDRNDTGQGERIFLYWFYPARQKPQV
jgi:hypothetical protein